MHLRSHLDSFFVENKRVDRDLFEHILTTWPPYETASAGDHHHYLVDSPLPLQEIRSMFRARHTQERKQASFQRLIDHKKRAARHKALDRLVELAKTLEMDRDVIALALNDEDRKYFCEKA